VATPTNFTNSHTFLTSEENPVDWSAATRDDIGDYKVTITATVDSDQETCSESTFFYLKVAL
jgi:hypothetical protein